MYVVGSGRGFSQFVSHDRSVMEEKIPELEC